MKNTPVDYQTARKIIEGYGPVAYTHLVPSYRIGGCLRPYPAYKSGTQPDNAHDN